MTAKDLQRFENAGAVQSGISSHLYKQDQPSIQLGGRVQREKNEPTSSRVSGNNNYHISENTLDLRWIPPIGNKIEQTDRSIAQHVIHVTDKAFDALNGRSCHYTAQRWGLSKHRNFTNNERFFKLSTRMLKSFSFYCFLSGASFFCCLDSDQAKRLPLHHRNGDRPYLLIPPHWNAHSQNVIVWFWMFQHHWPLILELA